MACLISPTVFMTNGPWATTGSLMGAPERINIFVLSAGLDGHSTTVAVEQHDLCLTRGLGAIHFDLASEHDDD